MKKINPLHDQLLKEVKLLRQSESKILTLMQQVDEQKLYLELGFSSLFKYAVEYLGLSESQSYSFMTVSRKSRVVPELKKEIETGDLSLSKARRIVPVLSKENHEEWIEKAKTLNKAELEKEVSKVSPYTFKKKVVVRSLSKETSSLRLEVSDEVLTKWKRMQTLMMSKKRKTLNLTEALDALVSDFLEKNDPLLKTEPRKSKMVSSSKEPNTPANSKESNNPTQENLKSSGLGQVHVAKRHIPRPLKRQVIQRDRGQCQFKGSNGNICGNESFIQIHHLQPWAEGGKHTLENLQTLCSAHHSYHHNEKEVRVKGFRL